MPKPDIQHIAPLFSPENYLDLVSAFINAGYVIKKFSHTLCNQKSEILLLRHDVDIAPELALRLAKLEAANQIQSSYSFMLRSPFYDALSVESASILLEIHELGHDVFLHIDPFLYQDFNAGLQQEMDTCTKYFPYINAEIYSLHRPSTLSFTTNVTRLSLGLIQNVSSKMLFGCLVDYISDSMGEWRNGYPTAKESFRERKSIQLVTHPIWWMQQGDTPVQKLRKHLGHISSSQIETIKSFLPKFYEKNCAEITLSRS